MTEEGGKSEEERERERERERGERSAYVGNPLMALRRKLDIPRVFLILGDSIRLSPPLHNGQ